VKIISRAIIVVMLVIITVYHTFTVNMAYHEAGNGAAIIAFLLPGLSEIYWFVRLGMTGANGFNTNFSYTVCYISGSLVLLSVFFGIIQFKLAEQEEGEGKEQEPEDQ